MDKDILSGLSPSKLANHLGISAQGLFWYERENLITPAYEEGKRQYSLRDFYQLGRLRLYRQMGFTLDEANDLLDCEIDEVALRLSIHAQDMRQKLERDRVKIEIIEQRAELARTFREREGVFTETDVEPFYFKESFVQRADAKAIEKQTIGKYWIEDIPFTQYISFATKGAHHDRIEHTMGLMLPKSFVPCVSPEVESEISCGSVPLMDPGKALYGLVEAVGTTDTELRVSFLEQLGDSIAEKTMMKRSILSNRGEGETKAYWEVWFF